MASEEVVSRLVPLSPDRPQGLHPVRERSLSTSRSIIWGGLRRAADFLRVKCTLPSSCAFCPTLTMYLSVHALYRRHIRIRTFGGLLLRSHNSAFNELAKHLGRTAGGRHEVLREFRDAGTEFLCQGQTGTGRQQLTHAPHDIRFWCTLDPRYAPHPRSNLPLRPCLPHYIT